MNLVLFESAELASPLPLADPRAQHIIKVLRRTTGDTFVAVARVTGYPIVGQLYG